MRGLTAATTAWCKQNVEVMLTVLPCLKLHTFTQQPFQRSAQLGRVT